MHRYSVSEGDIAKRGELLDFDGDGDLDIVAVGTDINVSWYEGLGNLQFSGPHILWQPAIGEPGFCRISAGDFNGDGQVDLIGTSGTFNFGSAIGTHWLEINNVYQLGTVHHVTAPLGWNVSFPISTGRDVTVGDFDCDGDSDAMIIVDTGVIVAENLGLSSGVFGTLQVASYSAANQNIPDCLQILGSRYQPTIPADLDDDGDLDLLWVTNGQVRWMENNGAGIFPSVHSIPVLTGAIDLGVGDLDGDGRIDLIVEGSQLEWHPGLAGGGFGSPFAIPVPEPGTALLPFDVDDDGRLDLMQRGSLYYWWKNCILGACGRGNVGASQGLALEVLLLNGSSGGELRIVDSNVGSPVTVELTQPATNPNPAPFAIVGYLGLPPLSSTTELPFSIGSMCFNPLSPLAPTGNTFVVTNNFDPSSTQGVQSTATPWRWMSR